MPRYHLSVCRLTALSLRCRAGDILASAPSRRRTRFSIWCLNYSYIIFARCRERANRTKLFTWRMEGQWCRAYAIYMHLFSIYVSLLCMAFCIRCAVAASREWRQICCGIGGAHKWYAYWNSQRCSGIQYWNENEKMFAQYHPFSVSSRDDFCCNLFFLHIASDWIIRSMRSIFGTVNPK